MSSDKEFWLGKYYFKETEAPYGFTLDTKEYDVTLTWDKSPQKTTVTDETITEDGNGIDGETFRTLGVNHILTTGEKLNPLIKNAKTITFTWEKQPADAVDVSVSKDDGKTPAKMYGCGAMEMEIIIFPLVLPMQSSTSMRCLMACSWAATS